MQRWRSNQRVNFPDNWLSSLLLRSPNLAKLSVGVDLRFLIDVDGFGPHSFPGLPPARCAGQVVHLLNVWTASFANLLDFSIEGACLIGRIDFRRHRGLAWDDAELAHGDSEGSGWRLLDDGFYPIWEDSAVAARVVSRYRSPTQLRTD